MARLGKPVARGARCTVLAELGAGVVSRFEAELVRDFPSSSGTLFGFHVDRPDAAWDRCVEWLDQSTRAAASTKG